MSDVQRHGRNGKTVTLRTRLAGVLLLGAYLLFVVWFSFRPVSVPWVAPANLHPLHTIRTELADGSSTALLGFCDDLLLYAPLGVLLPVAAGWLNRSLTGALARTVVTTLPVATVITAARAGTPGYLFDIDTILLNCIGALICGLLFLPPVRALVRRRTANTLEQLHRPGRELRREHAAGARPGHP